MICIKVCDDERVIADQIRRLAQAEMERLQIPAQYEVFDSSITFLKKYKANRPELLFIDIEMPEKSGIDIIRAVTKVNPESCVVLITSHDNLILRNLRYAPMRFIRKPDMKRDIPLVIQEFVNRQRNNQPILEICLKEGIRRIWGREILYMEKREHYTEIHLQDGQVLSERKMLHEYEEQLSEYGFVRTHIGYLVNLRHCAFLGKNAVHLDNQEEVPVSRDRRGMVKECFMRYKR